MMKGFGDLTSLYLCGSKQNATYCGIENCAIPSLRLQVSCLKMLTDDKGQGIRFLFEDVDG